MNIGADNQNTEKLYKCTLVGMVEEENVQLLVERLTGLCENARAVLNDPFRVREVVFRRKMEEDPGGTEGKEKAKSNET